MNAKYTPGMQVAVVYEMGGGVGNRAIKLSREFATVQKATNWITPYIMDGYPFDICSAEYMNSKSSKGNNHEPN
jgi:hypothetical protein